MAKRRLNEYLRSTLNDYASQTVRPKTESRNLNAAYSKAEPFVLSCVRKRFPPADMAVLLKYEKASRESTVTLQLENGGVQNFELVGADGVLMPGGRSSYRNHIMIADKKTTDAVHKWLKTKHAYDEELESRLTDYRSLIMCAVHAEDILDVWPEAIAVLPPATQVVPLSDDIVRRIQRDRKERTVSTKSAEQSA